MPVPAWKNYNPNHSLPAQSLHQNLADNFSRFDFNFRANRKPFSAPTSRNQQHLTKLLIADNLQPPRIISNTASGLVFSS
jgi:hypothetical protein